MSAALNFALNCQRYGISTPQCPDASLRYWASYTKQRSPTGYDTYYAPLMAQLDPAPAPPTLQASPEAGLQWWIDSVASRLATQQQRRRLVLHL